MEDGSLAFLSKCSTHSYMQAVSSTPQLLWIAYDVVDVEVHEL
jgi:hypothetical protein